MRSLDEALRLAPRAELGEALRAAATHVDVLADLRSLEFLTDEWQRRHVQLERDAEDSALALMRAIENLRNPTPAARMPGPSRVRGRGNDE